VVVVFCYQKLGMKKIKKDNLKTTHKFVIGVIAILSVVIAGKISFGYSNDVAALKKDVAIKTDNASKVLTKKGDVKILFVGDMMFDRYIRQVSDKRGYEFVFEKVSGLFAGNDLIVGNLEGPITEKQSISVDSKIGEKNNYIFTFDSRVADILSKENIKLVSIGNNHISNFGSDGIKSTRENLARAKIEYFGDPENESSRMIIENIKGNKIAFVNYNQFVSDAKQKTIDDLNKAKNEKADFIILYTHWGVEFSPQPTEKIKSLAHEFVDAGASLIIGSHPHVIETKEVYNGKTIYYSLGNFIFDQYFDTETQKGLAVQIEIHTDNKNIILKDFPIKMDHNGQTSY